MGNFGRRAFLSTAGVGAALGVAGASERIGALMAAAEQEVEIEMGALSSEQVSADPIAYLGNVTVLAEFPIRIDADVTWVQGVSINEADGEIYVANQRSGGTYLRIDVRSIVGDYISSRTIPIAAGAYTEALPWFRNASGHLCFIVRTELVASYAIYNYSVDSLSAPIPILGRAKSDVDGGDFVTSDVWLNDISRMHVYDWESVKAGAPVLRHTIVLDSAQPLFEKSQGLVVNGGYYFVIQGGAEGQPAMTVFNAAGRLVTALAFDKLGFAEALNAQRPGIIANPTGYRYENEAGCTYQGKLVTLEVVNDHATDNFQARCLLVVHNEIAGARVQASLPAASHDTGWQLVALRAGIVNYAADTAPRWRRVGNQIYVNGAIKGLAATPSSMPIGDIPALGRPDRNLQWTSPSSGGSQSNWQMSSAGVLQLMNTTFASTGVGTWFPFSVSFAAG